MRPQIQSLPRRERRAMWRRARKASPGVTRITRTRNWRDSWVIMSQPTPTIRLRYGQPAPRFTEADA